MSVFNTLINIIIFSSFIHYTKQKYIEITDNLNFTRLNKIHGHFPYFLLLHETTSLPSQQIINLTMATSELFHVYGLCCREHYRDCTRFNVNTNLPILYMIKENSYYSLIVNYVKNSTYDGILSNFEAWEKVNVTPPERVEIFNLFMTIYSIYYLNCEQIARLINYCLTMIHLEKLNIAVDEVYKNYSFLVFCFFIYYLILKILSHVLANIIMKIYGSYKRILARLRGDDNEKTLKEKSKIKNKIEIRKSIKHE